MAEKLQALAVAYEKTYKELKEVETKANEIANRDATLSAQLKENELVKEELGMLSDKDTVYKLIGPILVKQELVEAKSNVNKRMEFIKSELDTTRDLRKKFNDAHNAKRNAVLSIEQQLRAAQMQQQQIRAQ
eukprot:TRINITY_DN12289_c0_g1_i1.p1 TRINITY_DN12289_c0_g1~~TRINITY_DN12289_c0_g1_i1.p1  ORF type:complete len:132 (-),score=33.54 TRINITY_DN12289_c0_g1_i1:243-638(-)